MVAQGLLPGAAISPSSGYVPGLFFQGQALQWLGSKTQYTESAQGGLLSEHQTQAVSGFSLSPSLPSPHPPFLWYWHQTQSLTYVRQVLYH